MSKFNEHSDQTKSALAAIDVVNAIDSDAKSESKQRNMIPRTLRAGLDMLPGAPILTSWLFNQQFQLQGVKKEGKTSTVTGTSKNLGAEMGDGKFTTGSKQSDQTMSELMKGLKVGFSKTIVIDGTFMKRINELTMHESLLQNEVKELFDLMGKAQDKATKLTKEMSNNATTDAKQKTAQKESIQSHIESAFWRYQIAAIYRKLSGPYTKNYVHEDFKKTLAKFCTCDSGKLKDLQLAAAYYALVYDLDGKTIFTQNAKMNIPADEVRMIASIVDPDIDPASINEKTYTFKHVRYTPEFVILNSGSP